MSLSIWFWSLWLLYSAIVIWLVLIQPRTQNRAAETNSDDAADVTLISLR